MEKSNGVTVSAAGLEQILTLQRDISVQLSAQNAKMDGFVMETRLALQSVNLTQASLKEMMTGVNARLDKLNGKTDGNTSDIATNTTEIAVLKAREEAAQLHEAAVDALNAQQSRDAAKHRDLDKRGELIDKVGRILENPRNLTVVTVAFTSITFAIIAAVYFASQIPAFVSMLRDHWK